MRHLRRAQGVGSAVKLLVHANGANNATKVFDNSQSHRVPTVYGDTKISTTVSKFGGAAIYFDGVGDYLTFPSNTDLELTGDFDINFFIYLTAIPAVEAGIWQHGIWQAGQTFASLWIAPSSPNYFIRYWAYNGSVYQWQWTLSGALAINTLYHCRVRRAGNAVTSYINGTKVLDTTYTGSFFPSGKTPEMGRMNDTGSFYYMTGYLDEFKIRKGYSETILVPTMQYGGGIAT